MQRPLEKRVDESLGWIMSIREMSHTSGVPYPVFEWSFGQGDGFRGGELRAWPILGTLVFRDRRESEDWPFESVEKALAKVDEYGWGEPPHIDEVFQALLEARNQLPAKNKEDAERIFNELRQRWQGFLS